jgi:iron complex outermembrane receptor protein
MTSPRLVPAAFAALLSTAALRAAETEAAPSAPAAPKPADEVVQLERLDVQATRDRDYFSAFASSATKSLTPLLETPQAVSVVTRQLMDDRAAQTLGDALALVPGLTARENYYASDEFTLRGFFIDQNTGYYLDGRRARNYVAFDTEMLERVEVVRGPASVLYGGIEPGGLVAMTAKRPLAEARYAVRQDVGSWQDYRTSIDVSTPFAGGGGIRVPVTYRDYDSFRDHVDDAYNFQTAPSLVLPLNRDTDLVVSGFYTDQSRVSDNIKIPLLNGRPAPLPRERFLGEPGRRSQIDLLSGDVTLTHRFTPDLTLTSSVNANRSTEDQNIIVTVFGFEPGSSTQLTRFLGFGEAYETSGGTQHDLAWRTETSGIEHRILVGVDAYVRRFEQRDYVFASLPSININDPVYNDTPTPFGPGADTTQEFEFAGLYLQDQATLLRDRPALHKLDVLAGLRADYISQDANQGSPFGAPPSVGEDSWNAVSPRLGLVWMPAPAWSVYGTWSQAFSPQSFAFDANGDLIEPQQAEQFEIGLKRELRPGLAATLSLFELKKTNVLTTTLPGLPPELSGEETARGVEFEVAGTISRGWQVAASYAYLDAFISKADTFANEGLAKASAPEHALKLWTGYTLPSGFGGGGGVSYVSEQFGDNTETLRVAGYTLVEASLWYRPTTGALKNFTAQLSVKNLFDKEYFLTGNGFGTSVQAGEPRSLLASVGYAF